MVTGSEIFIQIAAYRDRELIPTIRNAVEQAMYPRRLHFGICWQFASEEEKEYAGPLAEHENCRIITVPATQSKGVGWARAQAQSLWRGEQYTLQIDAHMRFAEAWDTRLTDMLALCRVPKPILTAYPPAYTPPGELLGDRPTSLVKGESSEGIVGFKSGDENLRKYAEPQPGLFVAAGFLFCKGTFIKEAPYDPLIYFHGEEVLLSVKAWCRGWNIYHPNDVVCWHYYNSNKKRVRPVHWTDQKSKFLVLRNLSKDRFWKCIEDERLSSGRYIVRSLEEYERITEIDLNKMTNEKETNFLMALVRNAWHPTENNRLVAELFERSLDWEYIVKKAYQLGLWLDLFQCLRSKGIRSIKRELLEELRNHFILNGLRNQYYLKTLYEILHLFAAEKVNALPVDGVLLLDEAGVIPIHRFHIVIDSNDPAEAEKLLGRQGFRLSTSEEACTEFQNRHGTRIDAFTHPRSDLAIVLYYVESIDKILKNKIDPFRYETTAKRGFSSRSNRTEKYNRWYSGHISMIAVRGRRSPGIRRRNRKGLRPRIVPGYRPGNDVFQRSQYRLGHNIVSSFPIEELLVLFFYLQPKFDLSSIIFTGRVLKKFDIHWGRLMKLSRAWNCESSIFSNILIADKLFGLDIPGESIHHILCYPEMERLNQMDLHILFL